MSVTKGFHNGKKSGRCQHTYEVALTCKYKQNSYPQPSNSAVKCFLQLFALLQNNNLLAVMFRSWWPFYYKTFQDETFVQNISYELLIIEISLILRVLVEVYMSVQLHVSRKSIVTTLKVLDLYGRVFVQLTKTILEVVIVTTRNSIWLAFCH